jgi:hypothetical protein
MLPEIGLEPDVQKQRMTQDGDNVIDQRRAAGISG